MDPDINNCLIQKKVIFLGTKNIKFTDGTKIYFHFKTTLCDPDKTVIDESRKMGKGEPMNLVLGKKFKLDVWETIIQKMSLNEVAQFTVDKSLVIQYPFVSKTLRDMDKPAEQRTKHCCGMMLQNDGVGYKDLNELIEKPQDLEFTIEIVKVESPDEYQKESWQLKDHEKLKMVPVLREKGNTAFKSQDLEGAENAYAVAIGYLEQLLLKEKPHDDEWYELRKKKVPLLLNFAQCKLTQKNYYAVIEHCNSVLEIDPDNIKALYKRGKAHLGVWNYEKAKKDLNRVSELDPTLAASNNKVLKEFEDQLREKERNDQLHFKKMFQ